MGENRHKQSIDSITKTWAILLGICMFAIYVVFDERGDPGRGQAAAISAGAIALAARLVWDLRNRVWFWVVITIIVFLHVPFILLIPWKFRQLSYVALLPACLLDFVIVYGIIRLIENVVEKKSS